MKPEENRFEIKCASKKSSNTCEKIHCHRRCRCDVAQLNYETSYAFAKEHDPKKKNKQSSRVFNYLNNKNMIHKHAVNLYDYYNSISMSGLLKYIQCLNVYITIMFFVHWFILHSWNLERPTAKFKLD